MGRWKLFGVPGWGSTLVEGALSWVGATFDHEDVEGFDQPGPARDRLLSVNPLARIPTLIAPDGKVMTESAAIVLHLAELYPQSGLAPPPDDPHRRDFLVRLIWFVATVYPTYSYQDYPERWAPDAKDQLFENVGAFRKALWTQFEGQVGDGRYVLGDTPSALDLYVACFSRWRPGRAWIAEHCPKLHAIALNAEQLPQLRPVIARNFP